MILPDMSDACPDTPDLIRQACHCLLTGEGMWTGVSGKPATASASADFHASVMWQCHWITLEKHRTG